MVVWILAGVCLPGYAGCLGMHWYLDGQIEQVKLEAAARMAGWRAGVMDDAPLPDPPCGDPWLPCPRPPD